MARTSKKKIAIKDEGVPIVVDIDSIDFTGAGVTGSFINNDVTEDISDAGSTNLDGGVASSIYLLTQNINGGNA